MKKILLSAALILGLPVCVMASDNTDQATTNYESTQWEYYAAEDYDGGTGTADDPYLIATVEQFMKLAVEIANKAADDNNWESDYSYGKYWKQTADLVFNEDVLSRVKFSSGDASSLSSTSDLLTFTGIGYYLDEYDYQVFAGEYDGDGHSISGLYMSVSSNKSTGLFNNIWYGTVKNLIVEDAYLSGNANVGLIAGKIENGATIYNCQTSGIIYCGGSYHAGIAGYVDQSQVYNCVSDAWLWAKNQDAGIAGRGSHSSAITNCFFCGWIGAVTSNVSKFTAWGAIVSELGVLSGEDYYIEYYDESGNLLEDNADNTAADSAYICENPSTVTNCYWTDTCTVRHLESSEIAAVDPTQSNLGVVENSYAVSIDDLATTVDSLNATAETLTGACSWELNDDNMPVLTFTVVGPEEESTEDEDTDDATAISSVKTAAGATVTARYTLSGSQTNSNDRGVQILRYSDGTVKKVIK